MLAEKFRFCAFMLARFSWFSSCVYIHERKQHFFFSRRFIKMHQATAQKPKTRSIDWFLLHILSAADRINFYFALPNNIVNCQSLFIWAWKPCLLKKLRRADGKARVEYKIN